MAVSFTVWVKPHLAVLPFDYSEVPPFLLAAPRDLSPESVSGPRVYRRLTGRASPETAEIEVFAIRVVREFSTLRAHLFALNWAAEAFS